jgi:hypothetical protein
MGVGSGTEKERDWTLYGFQTYYALLNCGFNLRPAAGTANGVHPVPLGFSRVYVHLNGPFTFESWMRGLSAGRSFVTTGPMLVAKANGEFAGARFAVKDSSKPYHLECVVQSEGPLEAVELIANGELKQRFEPQNQKTSSGAFETKVSTEFRPNESSWLAWRCFEKRPGGRIRFAHTGPWHFEVAGEPLRPRKVEADWLVARVKEEIERSRGIAPDQLIEDYRAAARIYEEIAKTSR